MQSRAAVLLRVLGITVFLFFCYNVCHGAQVEQSANVRLPAKFSFLNKESLINTKKWNYLLHLPDTYRESRENWPLLIYLHGSSLRGSNLNMLKRYGPPSFLDKREDFPFVVVSPQLPEGEIWKSESLMPLVTEIVDKLKIDKYRVYLTGVSMGGIGTWNLAAYDQSRFAAIAPLCGSGEIEIAEKLNNLPIWAFHGAHDKVVPIGPHQRLVDAVNENKGNAKLTVITEGTHGDIIYPTYKRDDLYEWFLSHNRKPIAEAKPLDPLIIEATPVPPRAEVVKPQQIVKTNDHTVKRGDTLWGISKTYNISLEHLKSANRLKTNTIRIGQVLQIPKG